MHYKSSSSWGCELKYTLSGWLCFIRSHPLREDVSWNKTHVSYRLWNVVILFVRMWVEMWYINGVGVKWERHPLREDVSWNMSFNVSYNDWMMSSSSWGCELKYINRYMYTLAAHVILFVRMWVEMTLLLFLFLLHVCHPLREDVSWNCSVISNKARKNASSSSWGCELKYFFLWHFPHILLSSSSWGCELKCVLHSRYCYIVKSSSSWGCELK